MGLTKTAANFFFSYLIWILVVYCASALGFFLSSVVDAAETAAMLVPVIMLPIILFGGLFANLSSFPRWIFWLQYLSPIRYGFEALVRHEVKERG